MEKQFEKPVETWRPPVFPWRNPVCVPPSDGELQSRCLCCQESIVRHPHPNLPETLGQQTSGSLCGSFECCYLRADEEAACRETSKINTLIHHCCSGSPARRASPGLLRQRVTFSTEQVQPQSGALTVSEGVEREAAGCKPQDRALHRRDSLCLFSFLGGE